MAEQTDGAYVLEIERTPMLIPTARMFAGSIARQAGCDEDAVLDAKIAISEICTEAVTADASSSAPIRITVEDLGSAVSYRVVDSAAGVRDPEAADGPGVGIALLRALFPNAEVRQEDGTTVVEFRVGASA